VPVMITAPAVVRRGRIAQAIARFFRGVLGGNKKVVAVTPEGETVEIPADIDSSKRFIKTDGSGLVETEQDGVPVVSRQAAE